MRELTDEEKNILEQMPSNVSGINDVPQHVQQPPMPDIDEELKGMIGQTVGYKEREKTREQDLQEVARNQGVVIGGQIHRNTNDIMDGWMHIDRSLFGERSKYYPEDWEFYIRPAEVEAIRAWSTIDDENANVIDDVFNEIVKTCFKIKSASMGQIPWGNLRAWDRFFILLLIRQYTFRNGDCKFEYKDECSECDNEVTFTLDSSTLQFDLPDPEIEHHYDPETCTWRINPLDYDVQGEPFTLYLPTLEKSDTIKQYLINKIQQNKNAKKKIDTVFLKFLPWMCNKLSKDETVAARQIRELEVRFKSYDTEMFSFVNDVINNIMVTPVQKLTTKCPVCGEEVSTDIRFPNGVSELFNITYGHKKFGKK